jgi:hypothetical protein
VDAFHHCEVERLRDVRKANIRSLLPKDLRAIADGLNDSRHPGGTRR